MTEGPPDHPPLRESDEMFRLLVDNVKDHAIFMLDPGGRVTTWNGAAERIKGYRAEEIVGVHFSRFYTPEDVASGKPDRQLQLAAAHGRAEDDGWRVRKDRSCFWANVVLTALRDDRGVLRGYAEVTRDFSDRQANEEMIRRLNNELRLRVGQLLEANRELESFSYSVSHDLRTPVRLVAGFARALLEDCGDRLATECRVYVERILGASGRMSELIDDLLGLSRLVRAELRKERVDLGDLARQTMAELQATDAQRRVEFHCIDAAIVTGDPVQLRVVVENLLGNAWKFTSRNESARIEFGREQRDGRTVYFVRDDGAGFDMAGAGRLFGVFQRLHGADEFEGHGIGLASVQRIVRRHGGEVWAEGARGKGATFSFTLGSGPPSP